VKINRDRPKWHGVPVEYLKGFSVHPGVHVQVLAAGNNRLRLVDLHIDGHLLILQAIYIIR